MTHRRRILRAGALLPLGAPALARATRDTRHGNTPFTLGVASGYPHAHGMVLWTRLAPEPEAPHGGLPDEPIPVDVEIAEDTAFKRIVHRRRVWATGQWAHSVHHEPRGLQPGRAYAYRFHALGHTSPVGHTLTTPAGPGSGKSLRVGAVCCSHYEHGYFSAYRALADDAPELIVHLGDYLYENHGGGNAVRTLDGPAPVTLTDYRIHHARYKRDPDLQRAHAACPWLVTWDDHEVVDGYARNRSPDERPAAWFAARRAAAYRAYYEHMPLPRSMVPVGDQMRLHTEWWFGSLARFFLLDTRQYRDPEPCPDDRSSFLRGLDPRNCPLLHDPSHTMLGAQQRAWLQYRLPANSEVPWTVLGNQSLMQPAVITLPEGPRVFTDGWDGYFGERQQLLATLARKEVRNPVVLSGDVHAFYVNALRADDTQPGSPVVASEFVCGAITSPVPSARFVNRVRQEHPAVRYTHTDKRGYVLLDFDRQRLRATLVGMSTIREPDGEPLRLARFEVANDTPGPTRLD